MSKQSDFGGRDYITTMTCLATNQWQQIFLLTAMLAQFCPPEGMEHNLPYSGGALRMLRGTPMEAESFVSLFEIFDLQSASAASAASARFSLYPCLKLFRAPTS